MHIADLNILETKEKNVSYADFILLNTPIRLSSKKNQGFLVDIYISSVIYDFTNMDSLLKM